MFLTTTTTQTEQFWLIKLKYGLELTKEHPVFVEL